MKDTVSGVGASIGLDRLLAGLEQLGIGAQTAGFIDALVFYEKESGNSALRRNSAAARYLEQCGCRVEVFPEPKKMPQQYGYAEKKGIRWGLFIEPMPEGTDNTSGTRKGTGASGALTPQDCAALPVRLKNLSTRAETNLLLEEVPAALKGGQQ